jgi:RND family efflux transporter MFP subunit
MERVLTVTGSLLAHEQATLSVKVAGHVKTLAVDLGRTLQPGDLIAQIDPRDSELRLQQAAAALSQARAALGLPLEGTDDQVALEKTTVVEQAKAILDEATANRERVLNLAKEGISSKSEMDTAEAAYRVAKTRYEAALDETRTRQAALVQRRAEWELARQQLADTTIRAPFEGTVQSRIANLGEYLPASAPVVLLVKTDPLRLRLEVPERFTAEVRQGQRVRLNVEGDTNAYWNFITRISPAIREDNRMLIIEADVPKRGTLRPGLFVTAQIVTQERDEGLAVPTIALVVFAGLEKVVVVHDNKALEKSVCTGRRGADWVEVVKGLRVGELVILDPGGVRTGQPVKPAAGEDAARSPARLSGR